MKSAIVWAVLGLLCTNAGYAQDGVPRAAAAHAFTQAEQALAAGDFTRAAQLYANMLERDSDQPLLWFRLGLAHQQLNSFRPALQAYDNALSHAADHGDDPELRTTIAKVHYNRALLLLDAAAEDLQQVAADALDPSYRSTHDTVQQLIDSALQSAGSSLRLERKPRSSATSRAKAYIYTAQPRHASTPPGSVTDSAGRATDSAALPPPAPAATESQPPLRQRP